MAALLELVALSYRGLVVSDLWKRLEKLRAIVLRKTTFRLLTLRRHITLPRTPSGSFGPKFDIRVRQPVLQSPPAPIMMETGGKAWAERPASAVSSPLSPPYRRAWNPASTNGLRPAPANQS